MPHQYPSHPDCTACPLHTTSTNCGIATTTLQSPTNPTKRLLVVGPNPSHHDNAANTLFTGPPGQFLRAAYLQPLANRLPDLAIHLTTAARCYGNGAKITATHTTHCLPHTLADILHFQPTHILCVGAVATSAITRHYLPKSLSFKAAIRTQPIQVRERGFNTALFFTFHPSAVLRNPALATPLADHIQLILNNLKNNYLPTVDPNLTAPCPTYDKSIISLDIETYGYIKTLPTQTQFQPPLSRHLDKCPTHHLIQTVSLTTLEPCQNNPPPINKSKTSTTTSEKSQPSSKPSTLTSLESLTNFQPSKSMVFQFRNLRHRQLLLDWLIHADTIIGFNLLFDLSFLHYCLPASRAAIASSTLVDLSILNFLESDCRPERGLKDLTQILGIAKHTSPANQFSSQSDPALHRYNAIDTYTTALSTLDIIHRLQAREREGVS